MEQCARIVKAVRDSYDLLRDAADDAMRARVAALINALLFDFALDEYRCVPRLTSALEANNDQRSLALFRATVDLVDRMVAISEWDDSVANDEFVHFDRRIADVESLCT